MESTNLHTDRLAAQKAVEMYNKKLCTNVA